MEAYKTKTKKLTGTDFHELRGKAEAIYNRARPKTKRRPYVRSAYFNRDKIFLALFWKHLFDKANWKDRVRRLKVFPASLELIRNSRCHPSSKDNPNKSGEILHRFKGVTPNGEVFYVQIKENKRNGQKHLISVFPDQ